MAEPACKKCGKPLEAEEIEYCGDCSRRKHANIRGMVVFPYDGLMRALIPRFKYRNRWEQAHFFGAVLVKTSGVAATPWGAPPSVPIPPHRSRRRKRGFNQAELVARKAVKMLGIPLETGVL